MVIKTNLRSQKLIYKDQGKTNVRIPIKPAIYLAPKLKQQVYLKLSRNGL